MKTGSLTLVDSRNYSLNEKLIILPGILRTLTKVDFITQSHLLEFLSNIAIELIERLHI